MTDAVEFLDLDDVVELAVALLGDPPPIGDLGLLGSTVARPETTLFGQDAYPDLWSKAAALLQSIVNNHALVDGNKRLGWLATAVFLEINGIEITGADNDEVYDLVLRIAADNPPIEEIATDLRQLIQKRADDRRLRVDRAARTGPTRQSIQPVNESAQPP